MNTTKLAVAKVCHEFANHISAMKFAQEDIMESLALSDNDDLKLLFESLDAMSVTLDLFRSIFGTASRKTDSLLCLLKLYASKGMKAHNLEGVNDYLTSPELERLCATVAYLVFKFGKRGDIVSFSIDENGVKISITSESFRIPTAISEALTEGDVEIDVFNILGAYAATTAKQLSMKIELGQNDNVTEILILS